MTRNKSIFSAIPLAILLFLVIAPAASRNPEQCTSAVLLPSQSSTHSAVIWKNRDTSVLSNRVVFVAEQPFSYLGLCNLESHSGRMVYAGLNSEGFGIINTVAYNLPGAKEEMKDLEGIIMADALRTCRRVEDFEQYLKKNLGPDLGSQANFAVLDGQGKALLFEVHNHGYHIIDPSRAGDHGLINTNFSRSGEKAKGAGYLRFDRASQLFDALPSGPVPFSTLLTRFTRDTGNALVRQPIPFDPLPASKKEIWISTRDSINKLDTSAAIVIVGKNPKDSQSVATLWIIPGEPITAPALPLWVEARSSPPEFHQGDEAALWSASLKLKRHIRPLREGNKGHYLNLSRLIDPLKGGYFTRLVNLEKSILHETRLFLAQAPKNREYRLFQENMARKALNFMMKLSAEHRISR